MSRKSRQTLSDETIIDIVRSSESAKVSAVKHNVSIGTIYHIRSGRSHQRLTNGRPVVHLDPSERDLYDELQTR